MIDDGEKKPNRLKTDKKAGTWMIANIIDRRRRQYRWKAVDAIIEPTWHDNLCSDSDHASRDEREPGYATKKGISLADAIGWAMSFDITMTLYLYDEGSDVEPDLPVSPDAISN